VRRHRLKTDPGPWWAVEIGEKTWEYRENDRDFERGDIVELEYFDPPRDDRMPVPGAPPRADVLVFRIGFILHGGPYGIPEGYCIFTLEPLR
jgi:hypothetical protein